MFNMQNVSASTINTFGWPNAAEFYIPADLCISVVMCIFSFSILFGLRLESNYILPFSRYIYLVVIADKALKSMSVCSCPLGLRLGIWSKLRVSGGGFGKGWVWDR